MDKRDNEIDDGERNDEGDELSGKSLKDKDFER